ncbi:MAG TPA: AarF/ABC1/UbiB kinase family protein, partial [Thermoanaerobaculia bacterium]|nr:AarF/ABC1/UbiB kinase family protein [Thermoanaerobaculia bacterium]
MVLPFPPRPSLAMTELRREAVLPAFEEERVGVSSLSVALRLIELLSAIVYLSCAALFDWLILDRRPFSRRGSPTHREQRLVRRRAVRLRETLERLGGTFIKVGQQMSIRADVFAPTYCQELERLLDEVYADPIPEGYIREVIHQQTGKPLTKSFSEFDFSPVGKASIACVYKAVLRSGETVAVKIRRPNIKRLFKADLTALSWVLRTAEFLTILRPQTSTNFRSELSRMLLEELDFRLEVRYQELFRRYFKRRKKLNTTAPKLYFELCGQEIIVSEFVTGVGMKDLLAAVEAEDTGYLEALRAHGIDPRQIAKQLVRGSYYGFFECPFFHGDPHPGNIVIQPGNRIVLLDFGACGVFAERERNQLAQMHYYHSQENVGGMVQCVIQLMEPLPPIDLDGLRQDLESAWWKGFYGIKSHHSGWQERTSYRLWEALFQEVIKYHIPLPLNVLRMIRATLLYDSVAARIHPRVNVFREYRKYYASYCRRIQRDVQESLLRQLFFGPDPANYVRLKRFLDVGEVLLRRVQIFLQKPMP